MARRKRTVVTTQTTKPNYLSKRYFVTEIKSELLDIKGKELFPINEPSALVGVFLDKEPMTCELPKSMFLNTVEYGDSFHVCDILMYVQFIGYNTVKLVNYKRNDVEVHWLSDLIIEDGEAVQNELPFQ